MTFYSVKTPMRSANEYLKSNFVTNWTKTVTNTWATSFKTFHGPLLAFLPVLQVLLFKNWPFLNYPLSFVPYVTKGLLIKKHSRLLEGKLCGEDNCPFSWCRLPQTEQCFPSKDLQGAMLDSAPADPHGKRLDSVLSPLWRSQKQWELLRPGRDSDNNFLTPPSSRCHL